MFQQTRVPEISVQQLQQRMEQAPPPLLVDIREEPELSLVRLPYEDVIELPMSSLAARGLEALPAPLQDRSAEAVIICHHGIRSAQVTVWMESLGWKNIRSLAGGVDAFAREIDSSIGFY